MGLMNRESEQIDREIELIQDAFSEFTMNDHTGHDTNDFVDAQQIRQWLEKRWKAELARRIKAERVVIPAKAGIHDVEVELKQEHWDELGLERRLEVRT